MSFCAASSGNVNQSEVFDNWWEGRYIDDICFVKSKLSPSSVAKFASEAKRPPFCSAGGHDPRRPVAQQ